jgi:hypothetical protein
MKHAILYLIQHNESFIMFTTRQVTSILISGKTNAIGALGENIVYNALRSFGIACYYSHNYHSGDIRTKTAKIEVKTATRGKDNRYRFCLRKNDKHGKTDYRDSDYLLLQTIDENLLTTYYLIPCNEITVKHITIGKQSKYDKYKKSFAQIKEYVQ